MERVTQWILLWVALLLFSHGFFQFGSKIPTFVDETNPNVKSSASPAFNKMIFMVIDALRADFVYSSRFDGFSWLRTHLQRSTIALARTPTVTLPRLKALTGGVAPHFFDLFNNFDGKASDWGDSWVKQAHLSGKKIVHFGDDTWERLFAGYLDPKSEGVHSFFVTDTVQVDRNVTRHLDGILKDDGWDILTLHYLGLDHVGHIGGVSSPLFSPKLKEMDEIIEKIYNSMDDTTLLVVLGDHGMTDSGNHGGSSPEETETACVFLSPRYSEFVERRVVDQVDVAPTISLLLGLPIPKSNTGTLITEMVPADIPLLPLLQANAAQLERLVDRRTACSDEKECEKVCRTISKEKSGSPDQYNLYFISAAILLVVVSFLLESVRADVICILTALTVVISPTPAAPVSLTVLFLTLVWYLFKKSFTLNGTIPSMDTMIQLLYAISMFSSTFIEEEHEFWYFIYASTTLWSLYQRRMDWKPALLNVILVRLLKYWNATGYLQRDAIDMKIILASHPIFLKLLYLTLICSLSTLMTFELAKKTRKILPIMVNWLPLPMMFYIKFFADSSVTLQRIAILLTGLTFVNRQWRLSLSMLFMLFLKPHNAFPLFILTIVSSHPSLILMHLAYFALGPCHLISSLDFSPAYLAQTGYSCMIAPLAYVVIWAGPILVYTPGEYWRWRAISLLSVMGSVALQRHHISVWTVFAPRIVFEFGWLFYYTISWVLMNKRV